MIALLVSLGDVSDGGGVDLSELDHALQTASRAERAHAADDVILAALLHDLGKVVGDRGHGRIAAEMLAPHVRPEIAEVVRYHGAFTARHWFQVAEADDPRTQFAHEPWFDLACTFVDDWGMQSFDSSYDSLPLEHFEPLVRRLVVDA